MDLAATILHEIGATVPDTWQGTDLIDDQVLADARTAPASARLPGWEAHEASRAALSESGVIGRVSVALRAGGWKLLRTGRRDPHAPAQLSLYQVSRDPGETVDLADREKAVRERLERDMMEQLTQAQHVREGIGRGELDVETSERLKALGYVE